MIRFTLDTLPLASPCPGKHRIPERYAVRSHEMIKRIDPAGCGCTDCMTGYSRPLGQASQRELVQMLTGKIQDATSETWTLTLVAQCDSRRSELATLRTSQSAFAPRDLDDPTAVQRAVRAFRTALAMRG